MVPADGTSDQDARLAIWPRTSHNHPSAVAAVGDGLVRLRLHEDAEPLPFAPSSDQPAALDPHHDRFVTVYEGRLYLSRAGAPTRSVMLPGVAENREWVPLWVTSGLGFIGDHTLVSLTLDRGLRLHRVSDGGALGEGPATVSADPFAATASGTRVRLTTGGQLQSLDVDPDAW
ncbi:hypothetical protein QR97_18585 [Streptomyces sp. PBH53]|nr:hypothetical protein QR97_18585 [Streptomyces sp. PBH53]